MGPNLITTLSIGAVVGCAIYWRVRRNFGRQPVNCGRMLLRISLFAVAGALVLIVSVRDMKLLVALLGGLACGAGLGYFGLRRAKFEVTSQGRFYTPHTYIGLFVTVLFLGRMIFRFLTVYRDAQARAASLQHPLDAYRSSPLTLTIFGVLIGYYLVFYIGVLKASRDLPLPASGTSRT